MADEKYVTKEGLTYYTGKIKEKIKGIQTGTFRGNFATKALLDAYAGEKFKNDYAIVDKDETPEYLNKTTRYAYNGTAWVFEYIVENNDCIKLLPKEPGSGGEYRFPFHFEAPVQNPTNITAKFHTLVINDGTTKDTYEITIPAASPMNDKAGLYTKALADKKADTEVIEALDQKMNLQDGQLEEKITAEVERAKAEEAKAIHLLGTEAGSGEEYHFTYFYGFTPSTDKITAYVDTITLDNKKTLKRFTSDIVGATSATAGLMTATDKNTLDTILVKDASSVDGTLTINKKDGTSVTHSKTAVLDSVESESTTDALSAKKGKELNDRIDSLSAMGRYLATWDCTTGKPTSNPPGGIPYTYKTGDYYIVSKVGTTNLIPNGTQYDGNPSTTTTTDTVAVNDTYRFDSNVWVLLHTEIPTTTFGTIAGYPTDNANLAAEFDKQVHLLGKEPGSGEEYHFPFNINALVQEPTKISTSFDTITLNNSKTKVTYPISIPSADPENNKAGLYNKTIHDDLINKMGVVHADLTTAIGNECSQRMNADTALQTDINNRIPMLGAEPGSGQPYHFPFNINAIVQDAEKISTTFDTITLDGRKEKQSYPIVIPSADIANNKAGLYTPALAGLKADQEAFEKVAQAVVAHNTRIGQNETLIGELNTKKAEKSDLEAEVTNRTNADTTLTTAVNLRELLSNKVVGFQATPDDTHYPSEKLVYDHLKLKTDRELVIDGVGKSIVSNLTGDGGACMKFEHIDGTWSGIAVNSGGKSGICAQIYAVSSVNPSGECRKINVKKSGIYYLRDKASGSETDDDEIATKGDIMSMSKIRRETLDGSKAEYSFTLTSENKCMVQVYGTDGIQIIPNIKQDGKTLTLTFSNNTAGTVVILE